MKKLVFVLALLCLVGCAAPRTSAVQSPPLDPSPAAQWTYGAYLLGRGDAAGARAYLEPLASVEPGSISSPAQLWRDLAEARLFSGDSSGAEAAARQANSALDAQPRTAQFRPDDRAIFGRTLVALEAAASGDLGQLQQLAADQQPAPAADASYLLGWLYEQRGDTASARAAYAAYLRLAPQWSFLREATTMRAHAQRAVTQ